MTDEPLDIYDPDPNGETPDDAQKFLYEHRKVANDNRPSRPAYFTLWDSFYYMDDQEYSDLQQRVWEEVKDYLHLARQEALKKK